MVLKEEILASGKPTGREEKEVEVEVVVDTGDPFGSEVKEGEKEVEVVVTAV